MRHERSVITGSGWVTMAGYLRSQRGERSDLDLDPRASVVLQRRAAGNTNDDPAYHGHDRTYPTAAFFRIFPSSTAERKKSGNSSCLTFW